MRVLLLAIFLVPLAYAGDNISYIKRGDFKYADQRAALVPYSCDDDMGELCDEIDDVFGELLFEQFDTNLVGARTVRKALRQSKLKRLEPENMAAIANHLKVDLFVRLNLEIVEAPDDAVVPDATRLIKAEIELLNPQTGNAILQVDSEGRGQTSVRDRFERLFRLGFE